MASSQKELWNTVRRTVLLVDDDLDDVLFFEMAISRCASDIDVVHAHDGAQAMELLSNGVGFVPDLIITDIKMPGINGFEFLEMLKARPELSKLPVIVFSSSGEAVDRQQAAVFDLKGYHVKPVGHQALLEEVRRIFHTYLTEKVASSAPDATPTARQNA